MEKNIITLVLEVICSDAKTLRMSLFEKGQFSPLKTVTALDVDFSHIERLNLEIAAIINKVNKKSLLDEGSVKELKKASQLLYELLLSRQVKNRLSSSGSENLILSLDERLAGIPWELLFDGKDFLSLRFNLGRSIHTQSPEVSPQYRNISTKPKMLILANPTGDLKSAYQEGLYIKNYLTKLGKVSVDFKAQDINSNYVRKNLCDYDIVHFAGHCEYDINNPQESGWVLSDGWVSAREFLQFGENSKLPSIVFANACQSAHASNHILDPQAYRNVYGLAQGFLFAGVRHYIGNFFRIEDTPSWEFAQEFYNQIASGRCIGEAIRIGRLKLIKQYSQSHVAWAGYVLYGDPDFILFRTRPFSRISPGRKILLESPFKRKKLALSLLIVAAFLGFILFKNLPTFNLRSYVLFPKTHQLYLEGKNSESVFLLNQIIKQDPLYLASHKLLGDVYFRLGERQMALASYFEYARLSQKKGDHKQLAGAFIKIAWTYHMWGDYPNSKEFYQKALEVAGKYKDRLNEADALARLGVWYVDKGDNENAFSLLMKSSEINRERKGNPEHRFNLACDYFNIAFLYTEKGDYPTAKEFFDKSRKIFESLGAKATLELSDYYFDMGEVAFFQKDYDLALEFYQKGLALDKKLDHRFNLSSDYLMLGEFHWKTGRFLEAENYFKESIFIAQQINIRPVLAEALYDLGLMYKEMGETQKAKESLFQALQLYKEIDTPDYQKVQQAYLNLNPHNY